MSEGKVRLDKWLWAARFFKTRALSVEAIEGGKVRVQGERVKRAKQIQPGEEIAIRLGPYEHIVQVVGLSERRGPASEAVKLYAETAESIAGRERIAFQLKAAHTLFVDSNERPTKKDRRELEKFKREMGE